MTPTPPLVDNGKEHLDSCLFFVLNPLSLDCMGNFLEYHMIKSGRKGGLVCCLISNMLARVTEFPPSFTKLFLEAMLLITKNIIEAQVFEGDCEKSFPYLYSKLSSKSR